MCSCHISPPCGECVESFYCDASGGCGAHVKPDDSGWSEDAREAMLCLHCEDKLAAIDAPKGGAVDWLALNKEFSNG